MNKIVTPILLKFFLIILLGLLIISAYQFGILNYLKFEYLKNHLAHLQLLFSTNPMRIILIYLGIYIFTTAISIPGATVLSLCGGAIFGTFYGTILVSFASTIGATLSFLISRFLLRDYIGQKFRFIITEINKNIESDGSLYILGLRLIPVFPFFVVNMAMGLTSISPIIFFIFSQVGMLPATIVYVYAGRKISQLNSVAGIINPSLLLTFVLLGSLPFFAHLFISALKKNRLYKRFEKPKVFDFNMIVIGGGAAGLVTSFISASLKAKVALVEKSKMGGDCLNFGCVPSKALIKSAKIIHSGTNAELFGLKKIDIDFDFGEIMTRVRRVVTSVAPHDSAERYASLGVECFHEEAKILSPYSVLIGEKIYTTKSITIATGSKPSMPEIKGIESANYVTSETIWDLKCLPKKFLIIGGGAIGCELAQCFARFGSEVTMIERSERLLIREDLEVSALIKEVLTNEGVKVFTDHSLLEFTEEEIAKFLICKSSTGIVKYEYDLVLIAMGRKANTKGFGLEELGIALRSNGVIETNEFMQSTYPNIFACGDVAGPYQLTHMACHQAWYCAINGLFGKFKKIKVDYSAVPWCTFTDPEVATVGINETAALDKKYDYEVTIYHLNDLDRAMADDETKGFVKVITQKGTDKILGATIVGSQANLMILEFISAMKYKKGLKQILRTIHIYPSLGEANKYAAGVWRKNHAPKRLLKNLEKYFNWER